MMYWNLKQYLIPFREQFKERSSQFILRNKKQSFALIIKRIDNIRTLAVRDLQSRMRSSLASCYEVTVSEPSTNKLQTFRQCVYIVIMLQSHVLKYYQMQTQKGSYIVWYLAVLSMLDQCILHFGVHHDISEMPMNPSIPLVFIRVIQDELYQGTSYVLQMYKAALVYRYTLILIVNVLILVIKIDYIRFVSNIGQTT